MDDRAKRLFDPTIKANAEYRVHRDMRIPKRTLKLNGCSFNGVDLNT
jgi:hypothetical protein